MGLREGFDAVFKMNGRYPRLRHDDAGLGRIRRKRT